MTDHALMEQLNGLIGLLQAVGIDSVDNREMKKASMALKNNGLGAPIVFPPDIPEAKQLNDDQIQAMILKLQQAKAQAPNLMEALEDYIGRQNAHALATGTGRGAAQGGTTAKTTTKKKKTKITKITKKKKGKGKGAAGKLAPSPRDGPSHHNQQNEYEPPPDHMYQPPPPEPHPEEYEEEEEDDDEYEYVEEVIEDEEEEEPPQRNDHDDYDEDEDDDDFDEDADYPMVGPGISDDISVVSDMTTPTVVSCLHVNEEEQYSDMLPSMYIAQSGNAPPMMVKPPKKKNLVSKVGGRATAAAHQHPGGAANRRRQTYQQTMSKLHQNPYGTSVAGPAKNTNVPVIAEEGEDDDGLNGPSQHSGADSWAQFDGPMDESGHTNGSKPKKKVVKKKKTAAAAGQAGGDGTRGASPTRTKKKKDTTIDKEGFPADGEGKPKKGKDHLAKSTHSSASDANKVIKKKKKVVKKAPAAEGGAAPPKPKKKVAPKT